jgi:hypothetical protein
MAEGVRRLWGPDTVNASSFAGLMSMGKCGMSTVLQVRWRATDVAAFLSAVQVVKKVDLGAVFWCACAPCRVVNYQHAPAEYDRKRLFLLAMPHVGISQDGQVGSPEGLLSRLRKEIERADVGLHHDPLDAEYVAVKQKLLGRLKFGKIPSLACVLSSVLS